jgi:ubiquinone/menaquinone biosynthesis C-methylase UbiE
MATEPSNDLKTEVAIVAASWESSPYYADAEKWTHLFWREGGIFRRLFDRMNIATTIELACGHGRHAEQIARRCNRLILMDVIAHNIEISKNRVNGPNIEYHVGNGYDFTPVKDGEITAIFCYDAMVHFSPNTVRSYLNDTRRVLAPGGMALFHHSNYDGPIQPHYGMHPHARNYMPRLMFQSFSNSAGLAIVESAVIDWGDEKGLDCITLLQRP